MEEEDERMHEFEDPVTEDLKAGATDNEANVTNDETILKDLEEVKTVEEKRKRRSGPRPKLNAQRVCGLRGISVLPSIMKRVKFKGQGYEFDDLDVLMAELERWAHRLFPKMHFDDFLEHMANLGNKRPVQICLNRMRSGLPFSDADFLPLSSEVVDGTEKDKSTMEEDDAFPGFPMFDYLTMPTFNGQTNRGTKEETNTAVKTPSTLSQEQQDRMESNRRRALELKRSRQSVVSQESDTFYSDDTNRLGNAEAVAQMDRESCQKILGDDGADVCAATLSELIDCVADRFPALKNSPKSQAGDENFDEDGNGQFMDEDEIMDFLYK